LESLLCGHAWQQRPIANILWDFHENGTFSAMYVFITKKSEKVSLSGAIFKKGTFTINDSCKTLRIRFDSSYIVYSFDSILVKNDTGIQDWHLITVTNNKIVLTRPPVWDFEKNSIANKYKEILVTMDGGKKRRNRQKSKQ
jgi:hypothetical protein